MKELGKIMKIKLENSWKSSAKLSTQPEVHVVLGYNGLNVSV